VTTAPAPYGFFLITQSDGDVRIHRLTEEQVIARLATDEDTGELTHRPYRWDEQFDADPDYWEPGRHLIIRGSVVTPQPVNIRYELK
jgi:hypothetical protein